VETHKPKFWRGPGEFFREYLIIVIGVLTALGGQQAVDWIHQKNELAETREALREEIAEDLGLVAFGAAADRCRSAVYEKYVDWARGGNRPEGTPPRPSVVSFAFSAWQVAKAGPLSRMPVNERLIYSKVYERLEAQQIVLARQVDVGLALVQYFDLEQLYPDQAQRVLELSTASRSIIAVKERVASEILDALQPLGVLPQPVSESRRQTLKEFCEAAGVPVPTL
jgi:hypothetical protein